MSMFKRLAVACLISATALPAFGQSRQASFVIHAAPVPAGELTAKPNAPILVQKVTGTVAARLEEEAPTLLGGKQERSFAAGSPLFGARVPDGWIYCAVSKTSGFFSNGQFACYQDADADDRFEHVRESGTPFLNVPLFVYTPGNPKPLPSPVRYSRIPHTEGPEIELALTWSPIRSRGKIEKVAVIPFLQAEGTPGAGIGNARQVVDIAGGKTGTLLLNGAVITILGVTSEGDLRYRVEQTMPAQISSITMNVTTSYTYVPIAVR